MRHMKSMEGEGDEDFTTKGTKLPKAERSEAVSHGATGNAAKSGDRRSQQGAQDGQDGEYGLPPVPRAYEAFFAVLSLLPIPFGAPPLCSLCLRVRTEGTQPHRSLGVLAIRLSFAFDKSGSGGILGVGADGHAWRNLQAAMGRSQVRRIEIALTVCAALVLVHDAALGRMGDWAGNTGQRPARSLGRRKPGGKGRPVLLRRPPDTPVAASPRRVTWSPAASATQNRRGAEHLPHHVLDPNADELDREGRQHHPKQSPEDLVCRLADEAHQDRGHKKAE